MFLILHLGPQFLNPRQVQEFLLTRGGNGIQGILEITLLKFKTNTRYDSYKTTFG